MSVKRLLHTVIVLVTLALVAEAAIVVPASWQRLRTEPVESSPERECASRALTSWQVAFQADQLTATAGESQRRQDALPYEVDFSDVIDLPPPSPRGDNRRDRLEWAVSYARNHARRLVVSVPAGWLVGFDAGEYGGSLWWFPQQPGPGKKLSEQNVRAIVLAPDREAALAFVGLAHLGSAEGAVLVLGREADAWHVRSHSTLRGAPEVALPESSGALVVTTRSVNRVSFSGRIETIATANYAGLYPSSLAVSSGGEVAVGMRLFVALLRSTTTGYVQDWYIPGECATFRRTEQWMCECTGTWPLANKLQSTSGAGVRSSLRRP